MENLKKALLEQFDLVFSDETLLETAFTHTSYANEHRLLKISHNERLEFLGDAVRRRLPAESTPRGWGCGAWRTARGYARSAVPIPTIFGADLHPISAPLSNT